MHRIIFRQNKQNKNKKQWDKKHANVQGGQVRNCRGRRYKGKQGHQNNIAEK